MNPLARLKRFSAAPVVKESKRRKQEPTTFTYEGVEYAIPSQHAQAMSGFEFTSRAKAWNKYCAAGGT